MKFVSSNTFLRFSINIVFKIFKHWAKNTPEFFKLTSRTEICLQNFGDSFRYFCTASESSFRRTASKGLKQTFRNWTLRKNGNKNILKFWHFGGKYLTLLKSWICRRFIFTEYSIIFQSEWRKSSTQNCVRPPLISQTSRISEELSKSWDISPCSIW